MSCQGKESSGSQGDDERQQAWLSPVPGQRIPLGKGTFGYVLRGTYRYFSLFLGGAALRGY